jgi:hypothetical protein
MCIMMLKSRIYTISRYFTAVSLADWQVPRRDPSEPRPQHLEVAAQRRAAARQRSQRRIETDFPHRRAAMANCLARNVPQFVSEGFRE